VDLIPAGGCEFVKMGIVEGGPKEAIARTRGSWLPAPWIFQISLVVASAINDNGKLLEKC